MADPTNPPVPTDPPVEPTPDPPEETSTPPPPPPPPTTPSTTTTPPPQETSTSQAPPPPDTSEPPDDPQSTPPPADDDDPAPGETSTVVEIVTRPGTRPPSNTDPTLPSSSDPAQATGSQAESGGLSNSGKIAIAVVVPVVAVALFLVAAIWFWRRRKARKDAEEERRKEVEDYAYNPNADPTIPAVGLVPDSGAYDMREDTTSGYRGWGSTATPMGSTGQKASTTMSGGGYAGEPLVDDGNPRNDGSYSPEGEILGAMGPSAAANRGDIRRGPSNASSSYSAGGRSDGSDGMGGIPGGMYGNGYYDQYGAGNPYADGGYGGQQGPGGAPGQPVIRDNPARRNTRIESPSHYPQQAAGISQNF